MQDIDKLRRCLIDRQAVIDQVIDRWWIGLRAWVMARSGQFKHFYCCTSLFIHTFLYFMWCLFKCWKR